MYFNIHSGSCAPAERDLPSLATVFSQTLSVAPALALAAGIGETRLPAVPFSALFPASRSRPAGGTKQNLERLEAAKRQVDGLIAEKRATPTPEEEKLQKEIAGLAAEELAAARRLEAAAQRVLELEERIRSVQEGRSLARFLAERTKSEDYRKYLGVISTIRQDFESLGERLAAAAANAAAKDGAQRVDRIILYIDDLDRCPADKVMDVLQAVHLLLAYPLFVVVVGVDPRWLLHSLGTTYSAFQGHHVLDGGADDGWRSMPQNYLEKIFQIPFTLRPMTDTGYATLMKRLLIPPSATDALIADGTSPPTPGVRKQPDGTAPPTRAEAVGTPAAPPPSQATAAQEAPPQQTQTEPRPEPQSSPSPLPIRRKFQVNEQALTIRSWEASYAQRLFPLIPTPRAAKRFSNVYRLLKAPLPPADLPSFEGTAQLPGEFQVPMLLLAIVIGAPAEAVTLFPAARAAALQRRDPVTLLQQPSGANDPPAAQALRAKLSSIVTAAGFPHSPDLFLEWLPRVSRFSFELAGIVPPLHAQARTAPRTGAWAAPATLVENR